MMKKRGSIEDEYMHYNSDDLLGEKKVEKKGRDFLSTIISILIILVLLGVLVLGGFFGYKYLTNNNTKVDNVIPSKLKEENISIKQPKERMYTQKEMYEIVQTLMSKVQVAPKENKSQKESQSAEDEFVNTLQNFEEEFVENTTPNVQNISEKTINSEIVKSSKKQSTSHQNQVVVKKQSNYRDSVDKISNQINALVEEMQSKDVKQNSNYTKAISKEVGIRKNAMRIVIVQPGDTLSRISKRAYGSAMAYDKIFKANPNLINNPNRIYVGQRLRVPLD